MKFKNIQKIKHDGFGHGALFRVHTPFAKEIITDLMLVYFPRSPSGYGIVITTGNKAGHFVGYLPETEEMSRCCGIKKSSLISHWSELIFPGTKIKDVYAQIINWWSYRSPTVHKRMKFYALAEYAETILKRGTLFRLPGHYPYEPSVDFMLIDMPVLDSGSGYALIVTSGYKGGLIVLCLPVEATQGVEGGISRDWLIANWENWIYPETPVKQVTVRHGYRPATEIR